MKKVLILILILLSLNSYSQTRKENWTRLGLFTGSIVLNAVGDGLNDSGNKEWGHLCNAASIGLTLSIPLIIKVDKDNWYCYLLEYMFIRFAIFDYTYNMTRGLPYDYIGDSSSYDKALGSQEHLIFPKTLSLTVGIAINFQQFKR